MSARSFGLAVFTVLIAGCGGAFAPAGVQNGAAPAVTAPDFAAPPLAKTRRHRHVYWTLFAGSKYPQIQMAAVPLRTKSKASSVESSAQERSALHERNGGRSRRTSLGSLIRSV